MSQNKNPKVHQPGDLEQMQAYPLWLKVQLTMDRLRGWYGKFYDPYVSFSGGKDSTVLADLCAAFCKRSFGKLILVFSDTGLEYPEVKKFVPYYADYLRKKYDMEV